MTSLFPHAPYAEDQRFAHDILYLHTARAGAMAGTFISLYTAPLSLLALRNKNGTLFNSAVLIPRLFKHSGRGLIFGALFGVTAAYGRMMGREEIEWQDRAWRLLENKGEMATDWYAFGAMGTGAAFGWLQAWRGRLVGVSRGRAALGGAGLGMATTVLYMFSAYSRRRKLTEARED